MDIGKITNKTTNAQTDIEMAEYSNNQQVEQIKKPNNNRNNVRNKPKRKQNLVAIDIRQKEENLIDKTSKFNEMKHKPVIMGDEKQKDVELDDLNQNQEFYVHELDDDERKVDGNIDDLYERIASERSLNNVKRNKRRGLFRFKADVI